VKSIGVGFGIGIDVEDGQPVSIPIPIAIPTLNRHLSEGTLWVLGPDVSLHDVKIRRLPHDGTGTYF